MITQSEIEAIGWEPIATDIGEFNNAYILYTDLYTDEATDEFATLVKEGENWLMRYKTTDTYFGPINDLTKLQTLMTDFDIP